MECENCKQSVSKLSTSCNRCANKFCSNHCKIEHFFSVHQNEDNNSNTTNISTQSTVKVNKRSSVTSKFLRRGEFLKSIKIDPYFNYENFERVKMGKKTHILGSGAFGDVYLVKHKQDGKFFAVKQMNKENILATGNKLDIVLKEINIHSRLIHENIIRLFSYHEDQTSFYLILEYANSGTLYNVIKKFRGLDEKKAFKYFIQTVSAIYFIHENNLIHRDIKPENLLVDDCDNIKLCDFGWCSELEIGNRTTFCGTIEYMAPEIIKEMPYDSSIDVWSLGILLYELTHGYSPFRAQGGKEEEEYGEVFKNIIKYKLKFEKPISEECKDLITKLLTADITKRMKVRDIFSHPFVKKFEVDEDQRKIISNITNINTQVKFDGNSICHNSKNISADTEKTLISLKMPTQNNSPDVEASQFVDKLNPVISTEKKQLKEKIQQSELNEIKETLQFKKKTSIQEALEQTEDFDQYKQTDIFNRVIAQVSDRNKEKRKKSKAEGDYLNKFLDMKDKASVSKEKIVLKMERQEKKPIQNGGEYNFKILQEAKELEGKIDEHTRKMESLVDKKNDLTSQIGHKTKEHSSTKLITKVFLDDEDPLVKEIKASNLNNSSVNKKHQKVNINKEKPPAVRNSPIIDKTIKDSDIKTKIERTNTKISSSRKLSIVDNTISTNDQLLNKKTGLSRSSKSKNNPLKELDMSFLPKELLYNDKQYDTSKINLMAAIDLLDKAIENKKDHEEVVQEKTFWEKVGEFFNPFKCGK